MDPSDDDAPAPSFTPTETVLAMAEQTIRMIAMTRMLLDSGHRVDLTGLDHGVQLLCAKAFDLPLGETGLVQAELTRLRSELDALAGALPGAGNTGAGSTGAGNN